MRNNQCMLIGNVGMEPVERGRSERGPIVGFTVAENVQSFDRDTQQYKTVHTNWFKVTAFGTTAERIQRGIKKGDLVAIQGHMKVSRYTSKTGEERDGFEIIADNVALWKPLPSASPSSGYAGASVAHGHGHDDVDEAPVQAAPVRPQQRAVAQGPSRAAPVQPRNVAARGGSGKVAPSKRHDPLPPVQAYDDEELPF